MEEARVAEKGLIRQILNDYRLMKTVREIMPIYSQTYTNPRGYLQSFNDSFLKMYCYNSKCTNSQIIYRLSGIHFVKNFLLLSLIDNGF